MSSDEDKEKKIDIKSLVNIIPPASSLKNKGKNPPKEKRVKMRERNDIDEGIVIISNKLLSQLQIFNEAEISVKGKKIKVKVISQETVPEIEVWANKSDLLKLGITDNSTVTLRAL
ncbi:MULTISPECIES: hypothetical protein [Acidianus]|uniref:Uncharacterized protein n=1 Tax=Candidatus Acidianus copahuensis TaxID=1160895 RepID=A0A031LLQ1_9CREN|nr:MULTISPECIES: hypothetical protein [Acidianus]EZQ03137.1 hypothetical protein CM19_09925 [Candidatus Acidianus copahuensis]NON62200.1 hypothetical protein [Acidianus sp. RZ1]